VPASLLANWKKESLRFTPSLTLYLLHPSEIKEDFSSIGEKSFEGVDLVVTTYAMAHRLEWLSKIKWNIIIPENEPGPTAIFENPGDKILQRN
jgi:SNF2 family DNA or RNA helicase